MTSKAAFQFGPASLRALGISVALGALLYLAAMWLVNAGDVAQAVGAMGGVAWAVVLGLSLLNYGLRFVRWHAYLRVLGDEVPWGRDAVVYISGFALTTTPGKAGEALRSVYLAPHGVRYAHSLAALFTERLVDFVAIVILAGCVALDFEGYAAWLGLLAACLLALIWTLRHPRLIDRVEQWAGPEPRSRLPELASRLIHWLRSSARLLSMPLLGGGMLLGLISWGAEGVGLYVILQALNSEISLHMAVGIYALAILVGALSFIPGGLGSTEAAMGGLLLLVGVTPTVAVAATLVCRVATLWFAVGLGVIALLMLNGSGRTASARTGN